MIVWQEVKEKKLREEEMQRQIKVRRWTSAPVDEMQADSGGGGKTAVQAARLVESECWRAAQQLIRVLAGPVWYGKCTKTSGRGGAE